LFQKVKKLVRLLKNLEILPGIDQKLNRLSLLLDFKDVSPAFAPQKTLTALDVAKHGVQHDGLTYIPWEGELLSQKAFSDAIHASDTYCNTKPERQAYIDSQLPRLYRVFINLYSRRADLRGPVLDVASGWGILYPVFKKYLKETLPYSIAEMGGYQDVKIDGDAIDGCLFECEKDILRYDDSSFGLVCFFDCIEHLIVDPLWPLLEFNRVLKMGGRLVISTPNAVAALKILQIGQGENPATESQIKPGSIYQRHNREWTPDELKKALQCCGFDNFYYSTNPHTLTETELDVLAKLHANGQVHKPLQYFGFELIMVAEKVRHVTLDSDLHKDQRWPSWLYTDFDAYRKRPKVFPINISDDYS
jgi:SAM-dependent methyltransferase